MMIRRFVNIVAEYYKGGLYSVHRLDVAKHLFYQSRDEAQVMPLVAEAQAGTAAAGDKPQLIAMSEELPAPSMNTRLLPVDRLRNNNLAFAGLLSPRNSEGKVICMNRAGDAILYNADWNSTRVMPKLNDQVGLWPISVSVARPGSHDQEEDLYLMHKLPMLHDTPSCFHVLRFSTSVESVVESWCWESLPPPPFVNNPLYRTSMIFSHTLVNGGHTICVSSAAEGIGTYCFDTVEGKWRHAGDWMLPFMGRAEYVPDLKLWLGFSPISPHYLCETSCLSTMAKDEAPKLQHVWQDLDTPEDWVATRINLVNLGSGRFCIAKIFEVGRFLGDMVDWEVDYEVAVLTGVEIGKASDGGLQALKHRSIQYRSKDVRFVL